MLNNLFIVWSEWSTCSETCSWHKNLNQPVMGGYTQAAANCRNVADKYDNTGNRKTGAALAPRTASEANLAGGQDFLDNNCDNDVHVCVPKDKSKYCRPIRTGYHDVPDYGTEKFVQECPGRLWKNLMENGPTAGAGGTGDTLQELRNKMDPAFYRSYRSNFVGPNKVDDPCTDSNMNPKPTITPCKSYCDLCEDPVESVSFTREQKLSLIDCFDKDTYDAAVARLGADKLPVGHCLPPKRGMQSNCPWDQMMDPSLTEPEDTGKTYITRSCVIGPAGQQSTLPEDLNYQCARVAANGEPLTTQCTSTNTDDDPICYALRTEGMRVGETTGDNSAKYIGSGYHIPIEKLLLTVQGYQPHNMEIDPVTGLVITATDGATVPPAESSLSRQLCGYEKCPSNFNFPLEN